MSLAAAVLAAAVLAAALLPGAQQHDRNRAAKTPEHLLLHEAQPPHPAAERDGTQRPNVGGVGLADRFDVGWIAPYLSKGRSSKILQYNIVLLCVHVIL